MPAIQRPTTALFSDRHEVGEAFCFGRLSRAELIDPVVIAVSHGGVEVGFPYAWLEGGTLHLLPTEAGAGALLPPPGQVRDGRAGASGLRPGAPRLDGVAGRDVVLFDDGLASVATLVDAAQAIRRGGPRRFVLAVPVITPPVRRLFVPRLVDGVITARQAHRITPGAELYSCPEPLPPERARAMILDVLAGDARRVPALALSDGPVLPAGSAAAADATGAADGAGAWHGAEPAARPALASDRRVPPEGPRALRDRARIGVLPPLPTRERDWAAAAWLRLAHGDPLRLSGEES